MENRMFYIIGIDPGINGAVCIMPIQAEPNIYAIKPFSRPLPLPRDLTNAICFIESVHSSPLMGVASAFTFGENFGFWQGRIEAANPFSLTFVQPALWQRALGIPVKSSKKDLVAIAKQISKDKNINYKTADAFLIAEYGRRLHYTSFI